MKRLFIEIAKGDNDSIDTYSCLSCLMQGIEDVDPYNFFDTIIDNANKRKSEIINAILTHDEIYIPSALIYNGEQSAGDLFNEIMQYAILNFIEGKSVYFLREYNQISWEELNKTLVKRCFIKNQMFVQDDEKEKFIKIDIKKLLKDKFR